MQDLSEQILLPSSGRLLGLDLGSKTIGIAMSDANQDIATPMQVIRRKKFTLDAKALVQICLEHSIVGLVYGWPLNMDGSKGPRAQSTEAFCRNLKLHSDLPHFFWDERLSTQAVTRTLLEADASRQTRGKVVDKMAASFILQGYLDFIRNKTKLATP